MSFIDIHCHILPGIDDGPKDMHESVAMAKMAIDDNITHVPGLEGGDDVGRISVYIDQLLLYFIGATLVAVVSICILQVIARYAFNASFSWAEEISATLVLWAVWIGASLAAKSTAHLRLLFLEKKIQPRNRLFLRLAQKALTIFFAVAMAYASKVVLKVNENITLMSLPITVNVHVLECSCGLCAHDLLLPAFHAR